MEQSEKPRFDALMALSEFRLKRAFNRRDYEWKVTLGTWALLAAGIGSPEPLRHAFGAGVAALLVGALALAHIFLWIGVHWAKAEKDWKLAFWFAESAERALNLGGSPDPGVRPTGLSGWRKWFGFFCNSASAVQALTTLALAIVVMLRL